MRKKTGRCQTCQHWVRSDGTDAEYHGEWSGHCASIKFLYTGDGKKMDRDGFEYYDAECYSAGFYTAEDFGCVHWIPKS